MTWIISRAMMDTYENSHCSQEQEAGSSEGNFSDGERFAPLNVMLTQHPFWHRDKTTDILNHSLFGPMSRPLTESLGEDVLTWFREGFRVRTSPQPEKGLESKEAEVDFGEKWRGLSLKFVPGTSLLRTVHSLFPEDLELSSVTYPKWGMMLGGELWERTTSVDLTSGTESGSEASWPTPVVQDFKRRGPNSNQQGLVDVVHKQQTWPTPKARDWKDSAGASLDAVNPDGSYRDRRDRLMGAIVDREDRKWATPQARDYRTGGADRWDDPNRTRNLNDQVAHSFATPGTTGMSNGSGNCEKANELHRKGVITEEERRSMRSGNGGQLNPDWVEWLMAWPIAWTQLEPLERLDWRDWSIDPADLPPDHPDYVPRIATGIKNRVSRLKAIGNGQVPLAAATAWIILNNQIGE